MTANAKRPDALKLSKSLQSFQFWMMSAEDLIFSSSLLPSRGRAPVLEMDKVCLPLGVLSPQEKLWSIAAISAAAQFAI
jgi:hypothetical protein